MVSKRHAEITFCPENNAWCLQDLGSTNGTLHNNTSVKSVTNMAGECLAETKSEYARICANVDKRLTFGLCRGRRDHVRRGERCSAWKFCRHAKGVDVRQ